MIEVIAIANGYYGGKVRVPGERFGITDPEHFSIEWMETEDSKAIAHVRAQVKATPSDDATKEEARIVKNRAERYKEWLDARKDREADRPVETRRVNVGGTDGVVGVEVPKKGANVSAKDKVALAETATGRKVKGEKEADEAFAAIEGATGSDNDDRSRDIAVDRSADAPAPDWEAPAAKSNKPLAADD